MSVTHDLEQLRADAPTHVAAATELGCRLLVGRDAPFEPQEALALIQSSAGKGDADALDQMATLAASGAWIPQDLKAAFNYLLEAAERGSVRAQGQLVVLASDRDLAARTRPGSTDAAAWRGLRDSIDLKDWFTPPLPQQVSESPRIWRDDGFTRPDVCDWLIASAAGKMKPATMYHRASQTVRFVADRTNSEFFFDVVDADTVLSLLRIRISALVQLPVPHFEPPQMLHYASAQELKPHFDFLRGGAVGGYGKDGTYEGDRVVTFLLYLNDGYEGGETEFKRTGFRYKGHKGDAIFFANLRDGQPDRMTLHAGTPVEAGEKWLFSQWIHDRPFAA